MSTADKTSALQAALNTQVVKANLLYGAERLYINVYWQWATQHDTIFMILYYIYLAPLYS